MKTGQNLERVSPYRVFELLITLMQKLYAGIRVLHNIPRSEISSARATPIFREEWKINVFRILKDKLCEGFALIFV